MIREKQMNFEDELKQKVQETEKTVYGFLPREEGFQKTILEAMNYSMQAGGKRLRPLLMAETYRMFGGTGEVIRPFMAAMEMIHTHSLIHDDLPALDNDENRAGKKTDSCGIWRGHGDPCRRRSFKLCLCNGWAVCRSKPGNGREFGRAASDPDRKNGNLWRCWAVSVCGCGI